MISLTKSCNIHEKLTGGWGRHTFSWSQGLVSQIQILQDVGVISWRHTLRQANQVVDVLPKFAFTSY